MQDRKAECGNDEAKDGKMSEKNQKFQGCLPTKYSRCSGRFDFTSDRRCEHADDCARFQALRFLDRECGIENYTDIEVYMAADNCEYKIDPELFNVINGDKMSEEQTRTKVGMCTATDWDYRRGKIKPKCKDDKLSEEQTKYDPKEYEIRLRGAILSKALEIINGERQDRYGSPEDSFGIIAEYWNTYLESMGIGVDVFELSGSDIPIMMALFKIARMSGQKYTQDNFVDAAGYLGIADDMAAQEDGK